LNARYDLLGNGKYTGPKPGQTLPEFTVEAHSTGQRLGSKSICGGRSVFALIDSDDVNTIRFLEGLSRRLNRAGMKQSLVVMLIGDALNGPLPSGNCYRCDVCSEFTRVLPCYWFLDGHTIERVFDGPSARYRIKHEAMSFLGIPQDGEEKVTLTPQIWRAVLMPDQVLRLAWEERSVQELFRTTLERGSKPLSEVQLAYDESDSSILYQIRFLDRACPCSGFGDDAYNVAEVVIDPLDGEMLDLILAEGVSAESIRR
jgi:hypothetical protein